MSRFSDNAGYSNAQSLWCKRCGKYHQETTSCSVADVIFNASYMVRHLEDGDERDYYIALLLQVADYLHDDDLALAMSTYLARAGNEQM